MTQSAMRMNMAGSRPNQQDAQKRSDQQSSQKRSNQQSSTARSANTPSDVIANAASQTKDEKRGVFASMKQAMAPYVEGHSHTVLSVSYTHLDVYKRQEQMCGAPWISVHSQPGIRSTPSLMTHGEPSSSVPERAMHGTLMFFTSSRMSQSRILPVTTNSEAPCMIS